MTVAYKGGTVHTLETVKDVYLRLKRAEGDEDQMAEALSAMGEIFRNGEIPTEFDTRPVMIKGKAR